MRFNYEFRRINIRSNSEDEILRLVKRFSKNFEAYENILKFPNSVRLEFALFINNKIEAIVILNKLNTECVGCYTNISNYQTFPAIQEWVFFELFHKLREMNIQYLNLGGSETEKLQRFKLKLIPEFLLESAYFVYLNQKL